MPRCHRLLYTLQPPGPARRMIGAHRDRIGGFRSMVDDPRLHVTIAITGDFEIFPSDKVRRLCEIGAAVAAEPFEIAFDRMSGSAKSIALRAGRVPRELRALSRMLTSAMERAGLMRSGWSFNPHVTLGYREGVPFGRKIEPIRWDSQDFALIYSVVGDSRHERIDSWPLVVRQGKLF